MDKKVSKFTVHDLFFEQVINKMKRYVSLELGP